jgi:hypothetical protein
MNPIILRPKDRLPPSKVSFWKDLLYRSIKIGSELEVAPPKGVDRPTFEEAVNLGLHPSGTLDYLGEHGVWDVKPEHCGIEIRMIGRQPHFNTLCTQYQQVFDVLQKEGGRPRATCGLHFHLLTPGLAQPVPEIILANIWNLTRRYAPELKYLTSCGESRDSLCRRRQHNSHLEMIWHSPASENMREISESLKRSTVVPEHQNFLNLEHVGFTEDGSVLPFHLEFRYPDADISPTSVSAKTYLVFAIALKAVELSQYGVIHVGKADEWHRKVDLLAMLSNNDGELASSNTSRVTDEVLAELRRNAGELLDLLESLFNSLNDRPALMVLRRLAEKPVSLMRCEGIDWPEIEKHLAECIHEKDENFDSIDRRLMETVEFRALRGFSSQEAWEWQAARDLEISEDLLRERLDNLQNYRAFHWDQTLGGLVFIR